MFLVRDASKKPIYYNLDLACEIEDLDKDWLVTLPTGTRLSVPKNTQAGMFVGGFVAFKMQGKAIRLPGDVSDPFLLYHSKPSKTE